MRVEVVLRDGVELRVDTCASCGCRFEQERKHGRPRRYCTDACKAGRAPTTPRVPAPVALIKPDPPVRADGKCVVCRKPRKLTEQARRYAGPQLDLDPFCTTQCCRRWHGVELADTGTEGQSQGGQTSAAMHRAERGWDDVEEVEAA